MILLFVLLGFLPSLAWLIFFLQEDTRPEPKKMIAQVFIVGFLATSAAYVFQLGLNSFFDKLSISPYLFVPLLLFSVVEETLKFFAAYAVVSKSQYFDEPVDAMIYMIVAALGFALAENVAIVLNSKIFEEALSVMILRFTGATLLHALSSAVVGYFWAKTLKNKSSLTSAILKGIVLASLLHAFFNYLILTFNNTVVYPVVFLTIVAMFVLWDFERIKS